MCPSLPDFRACRSPQPSFQVPSDLSIVELSFQMPTDGFIAPKFLEVEILVSGLGQKSMALLPQEL